ncbi:hypothetical protein FRC19_011291 [Serendipita sp. 401]|nr:hypothetical protein FRC19_011291 [Serendipita sp. 401]KAG9056206.1 hypothetical protein FS842_011383 [Serendipita sp. 407]
MTSLLSTVTRHFDPDEQRDIPGIAVQITKGVGVYIIWAGITGTRPASSKEEYLEPIVQEGRLGADWACSMPRVKSSMPIAATSLLKTSQDAVALPLSQRLAQRFGKQIFVSIDIPPSLTLGGNGPTLALAVEKAVVNAIKSIEETTE